MKFEILLSCMNQKDLSIAKESNIKCSAIVINQCNNNKIIIKDKLTMINTETRGLSKSRNLALKNSEADICLLSDDDEFFIDDVEHVILNMYKEIEDADVIIFKMKDRPKRLGNKIRKLNKYDLLKVSSWQISFKLKSIKDNNISFDEKLGAGTGNGAGEENDFLWKCYSKKLKIYYVPVEIGTVSQKKSTWFNGYTEEYFYNRGRTTRYIMGIKFAFLYGGYFLIFKHHIYKKNITLKKAFKSMLKGMQDKL